MSLAWNQPIGFVPTSNPEAARDFYEQTLGLAFESDEHFALIFRLGPANGTMLRIVRTEAFTPASYTIFGWQVDDLHECVSSLESKGVAFLRYSGLEQDGRGIWRAPGGTMVAWFNDPDGNILSVSQHPNS